jgi:hypothetical protein
VTLAKSVLEAAAKLRALPASCPETGADVVDPAALARIADDLGYTATRHACESCAQLVEVADAARTLRSIERLRAESTLPPAPEWDLGALWTAQTALDAALAKVGER